MRARLARMRTHDRDRALDLREAIHHTGYYPDVVADGVSGAVAGEEVVSFYLHHEPTFDRDEIRRHLTVVVLTPSRLVVAHTDEHAADDLIAEPYTSTSTEAVPRRLPGFIIPNVVCNAIWLASGAGYWWPVWVLLGTGIGLFAALLHAKFGTEEEQPPLPGPPAPPGLPRP